MKKLSVFSALLFSAMSAQAAQSTLTDEEVVELIQPVGSVYVAGEAVAVQEEVASGPRSGEQVYQVSCAACHGTGVLDAPKPGTDDWGPRQAQGMDVLLDHALNGFNAMPARGTCGNCSDDEIKAAIEYMIAGK